MLLFKILQKFPSSLDQRNWW